MSATYMPERVCGSPIEIEMLNALVGCANEREIRCTATDERNCCLVGQDVGPAGQDDGLDIFQQFRLHSYEVDFALCLRSEISPAWLLVECDGHDFHERTKAQARHDRRRDRIMQAEGWTVFRFTGTEIRHEARACAEQCLDFLQAASPDDS